MLINDPERPLIPTAEIAVIVRDFRPIGDGCSDAEIELKCDANGHVRQDERDGSIVVRGRVNLEFRVVGAEPGTDNEDAYIPVAIGFEETPDDETEKEFRSRGAWPIPPDPRGLKAFPKRAIFSVNRTTLLTVLDINPVASCFKFSLIIQNADGKLGVIDPKIRNWPM
jgi:hypothetical protein